MPLLLAGWLQRSLVKSFCVRHTEWGPKRSDGGEVESSPSACGQSLTIYIYVQDAEVARHVVNTADRSAGFH